MSVSPKNIQLIGQELAVAWNDGLENFYALETLRRACPCAMCGGEPDVMGRLDKPKVHYTPKSFVIHKMNVIGGYALQITWGDMHDTGLYSWKYLRALGHYIEYGNKPAEDDDHDHHCGHGEHDEHHHHEHGHHCCGKHGTDACENK